MTKNQTPVSTETIAIQSWLRPALTPVLQNRDYERLVADLAWLDGALRSTGMEELAVEFALGGVGAKTRASALRKKAEFGNELLLAENPGGLIVDYMLYGKGAASESEKMLESVDRQQALHVEAKLEALVADRGFDAKRAVGELESQGIASHICPKNPETLAERLKEPEFRRWQTRRGATEARVAIFKNHGGGRGWRAKGLKHRRLAVGWSALAHNLTLIGRKVREQEIEAPPKAA